MEWISLKDRLPKNGQYVLAFPYYRSSVFAFEPRHVLRYFNQGFRYYLGDSIHTTYGHVITHWMPLQKPPKKQ